MSIMHDREFIAQVARRLNRFSKKSEATFNFRCNQCGDSKKDVTKKRGYFILNRKKDGFMFCCHNCGQSMSFGNWLKDFDQSLYESYIMESLAGRRRKVVERDEDEEYNLLSSTNRPMFKGKSDESEEPNEDGIEDCPADFGERSEQQTSVCESSGPSCEDEEDDDTSLFGNVSTNPFAARAAKLEESSTGSVDLSEIPDMSEFEDDYGSIQRPNLEMLRKISDLPDGHGAKTYLINRKIPEEFFDKLYIVWKFYTWCNEWKPGSFKPKMVEMNEEPRLVIPFYDQSGELMMIQGRSFKPDAQIRYFSIKCDDDFPKIYGLERVDKTRIVQVWEGPLDSMFGDNAVAMAGADAKPEIYFDDYVKIYDNEPRNPDICKRMLKAIQKGEKVVIWPKRIPEKYDGNDMIKKLGLTRKQLNDIIARNTYYGLEAELMFTEWTRSKPNGKRNTRNRDQFAGLGI